MTNDLIVDDIEQNEGNATAIVVSVVAVIAVALTIYLCIYGFKISKSTAAQGQNDDYNRAKDDSQKKPEGVELGESVQSFDEFIESFDALFKKTISDEDKEEEDFAPEYAELVSKLKSFIEVSKKSSDWNQIYMNMQEKVDSFKKPLRTLDQKGQCYKHVKEIQLLCLS